MRKPDWHNLYDDAYNWLLTYGPRLLFAIVVLFTGLWLIKLVIKRLHVIMDRREVDVSLKPFLISLIDIVLDICLFLMLMQIIGIQLTLFASLLAAIGVATGLALSGTLQNFTSGVLILILKPYRVGDSIIAQGQEGIVHSIEIFYTVITTYDNKTVIIPNSKLSNEVITNISREGIRRLDVELKFGFGADYKSIEAIIQPAIEAMSEVVKQPQPRIGVSLIEPDGYRITVNVWVHAHGFQDVKLRFQQQLIDDLKAGNIKLPGM